MGCTSNVFSAEVYSVGRVLHLVVLKLQCLVYSYYYCYCGGRFAVRDADDGCCHGIEVGCCLFGCIFDVDLQSYIGFQI